MDNGYKSMKNRMNYKIFILFISLKGVQILIRLIKMKRIILLSIFCMVLFSSAYAQKEKYQSLFIYNFTKYIKWPDAYNGDKFVIGVFGDSEIYNSLSAMANSKKKTATGKNIEIKKFSSTSDINDCNILFVSQNVAGDLGQIDSNTASEPVLIITDSPGLATQGAVINFIEKDGKIKFELNESKASDRGLIVSGSLTSLAIII